MSDVTAYGSGLKFASVDHLATFSIAARDVERSDLSVVITSPSDKKKRARLILDNEEAGIYRAEWKPIETGEHLIDVRVRNHNVKNGPFECSVGDPELVTIHNLSKCLEQTNLGKPFSFNIDASAAGSGNLEIMVNDGRVHCQVEDLGRRNYLATFVPVQSINYVVRMTFNGLPVKGSPWIIESIADRITMSGLSTAPMSPAQVGNFLLASPMNFEQQHSRYACFGSVGSLPAVLHSPASLSSEKMQISHSRRSLVENGAVYPSADVHGQGLLLACVGEESEFEIFALPQMLNEIAVNIIGTDGRQIPRRIIETRPGKYLCKYVCTEIGLLRVDVLFAGRVVGKSPYLVSTYDPSKVVVHPPRYCGADEPVQFIIDASKAGKGQLAISINRGSVPNNVQLQGPGRCLVTFLPNKSGTYEVDVTLNDKRAKGCPTKWEINEEPNCALSTPSLSRLGALMNNERASPRLVSEKLDSSATAGANTLSTLDSRTSFSSRDSEPVYTNLNLKSVDAPMASRGAQFDQMVKGHLSAKVHSDNGCSLSTSQIGNDHSQASVTCSSGVKKNEDRLLDTVGVDQSDWSVGSYDHRASVDVFALEQVNAKIESTPDVQYTRQVHVASESSVKRLSRVQELTELEQGAHEASASVADRQNQIGTLRLQEELIPLTMAGRVESEIPNGIRWQKTKLTGPPGASVCLGQSVEYCIHPRCANQREDITVTVLRGNKQEAVPISIHPRGNDFVVTFVPNTVGVHKVKFAILGEEHPQSPLTLKVYNPSAVVINEIEASVVGEPVRFAVDATHAGLGDLEIAIKDERGSTVPSKVMSQESNAHFKVYFTPVLPGNYDIHVTFNGDRVSGSPFKCFVRTKKEDKVASPVIVESVKRAVPQVAYGSIVGELPKLVPVGRATSFNLSLPDSRAIVEPTIIGPNSKRVDAEIRKIDQSNVSIHFTPNEVGDHLVDLKVNNQNPIGLPYTCRVYDAKRINVAPISDGQLFKSVHFVVDASQAGVGSLEVAINDGKVESMAQNLGNHRYDISFLPTESVVHEISIRFNGDSVPGSPFTCRILPSITAAIVPGHGLDKIRVDSPTAFEVEIADENSLDVAIQDFEGRSIPFTKTKSGDSKVKIVFVPQNVGACQIHVKANNNHIMGSPFSCKCYDPNLVTLSPAKGSLVNKDVSFIVDAGKAGSGNIEIAISVNGKNIPHHVDSEGNARFRVSFVPVDAKPHTVNVNFNQEPICGSPMTVNIFDSIQSCCISGPGVNSCAAGKTVDFTLAINGPQDGECNVIVTGPAHTTLPVKCFRQKDGNFRVEYKPLIAGEHKIDVTYCDEIITGSPFTCNVYDPQLVVVAEPEQVVVGEEAFVKVNTANAGKAELSAELIDPNGQPLTVDIQRNSFGEEELRFLTTTAGRHEMNVKFGDQPVSGSPMVFFANEAAQIVKKKSTQQFLLSDNCRMIIENAGHSEEPKIKIVDSNGHTVNSTVKKVNEGKWEVSFSPPWVGQYTIDALIHRKSVSGYPINFNVIDQNQVYVTDGLGRKPMTVGRRGYIIVDATAAGPADLKGEIYGPSARCITSVKQKSKGHYVLSFVPTEEGEHSIHLFWGGIAVPGSPYLVCAKRESVLDLDVRKVKITGPGLREAYIKVETEFYIDGSDAGQGYPTCQMIGQRDNVPITLHPIDSLKWKATYTPIVSGSGSYVLNVFWANQPVNRSPFTVQVMPSGNAENVILHADGLKRCVVGKTTKITVDTRKAGLGDIVASFKGPTKVEKAEVTETDPGQFTIALKSNETGRHKLNVMFNGEQVPGSPFAVPVSSLPDAKKIQVYGSGVEHGVLSKYDSTFYVDTSGAGAGQLAVRIKGPKGAFNVEMERDKENDRIIVCRYEPQEHGDYSVDVKWAGERVPGSPFTVVIFDTYQELDRFLAGLQVSPAPALPYFPPGWIGQPPPGLFPLPPPVMHPPSPMLPSSPSMTISPQMVRRMPPTTVAYGSAPSSPYFNRIVH